MGASYQIDWRSISLTCQIDALTDRLSSTVLKNFDFSEAFRMGINGMLIAKRLCPQTLHAGHD
jgi:hypothetical protein